MLDIRGWERESSYVMRHGPWRSTGRQFRTVESLAGTCRQKGGYAGKKSEACEAQAAEEKSFSYAQQKRVPRTGPLDSRVPDVRGLAKRQLPGAQQRRRGQCLASRNSTL